MSGELLNYMVFSWHQTGNQWVTRGRFPSPQEAASQAAKFRSGVVIDLVSKRCVWKAGKYRDRAKPVGIKCLPAHHTYEPDEVVSPSGDPCHDNFEID